MTLNELKPIVEALVFAADSPVTVERLQETLEDVDAATLAEVVTALNQDYAASGRAFFIRKVGGGYHISTKPEFNPWIKKLFFGRQKYRLSQASMETLAIIAFKQPISRVDIAQIRGVNSDAVVGSLMERKLVTIVGRSEGVGRPLLYGTTPEFLKYFGINDLSELPKPREIEELFSKEGLPDEVAQLLAETDKQLSLPISFEGEGGREGEPAAGQSLSAAEALPPAHTADSQERVTPENVPAPAHPTKTNIVEAVPPVAGPSDETTAPHAGATSANTMAWAAPAVAAVAVSELLEEPAAAKPRDLIDTLPEPVIAGTTESEEGVGFYGLFADAPEITAQTGATASTPGLEAASNEDEFEALAHLTEQEPATLLPELSQPAPENEVGTDTTELAAMEFNIREPDFTATDPLNRAAETLLSRFASEQDLGTTREFALLDGRLIDQENSTGESPAPEGNADLQSTGEIMLAALAGMDKDEPESTASAGDFNLLSLATEAEQHAQAAEPAAEIDGWWGEESLSEGRTAELKPAADDAVAAWRAMEEERERRLPENATDRAELELLQSPLLPPDPKNDEAAPQSALPDTLFEEIFADDMTAAGTLPPDPQPPAAAHASFAGEAGHEKMPSPDQGAANAAAPGSDASAPQTEPERNAPAGIAGEAQAATVAPAFFVPAPAQLGAGTALVTAAANEANHGLLRLWRKAVDWLKTTLTRFGWRRRPQV
ncbi:MAG: SMC-Scp complex subunit ScpB [candidate division KSB1 bacterium]|nr:SMC-Scp complex subunit ScpB [candidate division KSB1 bacterium]MDZ7275239.1 SMC-Scp complex subunit ScpB [candidate division KSB1 bacterium]MDZ7287407.1 SMC-Scp complex subunit ScpB [candidate division KSB1 bacterium]MDZ7299521.1 SMC-Scp complex subunit ScpB [candidate division KSB1 bacterium]MDZ7305434.1 SMC-Scp complex subunit ScpB [candidate division KSB1 bacterium]